MKFLTVSHVIFIIFAVIALYFRHRKSNTFFLNYLSYILIFGIFYISLPSIIGGYYEDSWVTSNTDTIFNCSLIGIYFNIVFIIGFLLSKDPAVRLGSSHKSGLLYKAALLVASIIAIYILLIIFINYSSILEANGRRAVQSELNQYYEEYFKIKPLLYMQFSIVFLLYSIRRSIYQLIFLIPFNIYSVMLSGRDYLFATLIFANLLLVLDGKKVKILYYISIVLLILSIGFFRVYLTHEEVGLESIVNLIGEFEFTWANTHLVYEGNISYSIFDSIIHGLLRVLPSPFTNLVMPEYKSFIQFTDSVNPFGWGLAGSMVAEAISFDSLLVLLLFPVVIIFYGLVMNSILVVGMLSTTIVYILSITLLQSMFRYAFIDFALYPFYFILFPLFFIHFIDFKALSYDNR